MPNNVTSENSLLLFLFRFSEYAKIRERGEHTRAVEHTLGVHPSCYPPLDFEHDARPFLSCAFCNCSSAEGHSRKLDVNVYTVILICGPATRFTGEHSNDHNLAVRSSTELILCMPYTSQPARNS